MNEVTEEFAIARSKTRNLYKALIHRSIDTVLYDELTIYLKDIDDKFSEIINKLEEEVSE